MHWSWRRLLRRGLEFHVCTINRCAHTKKSGNLFNDPRIISVRRDVRCKTARKGNFVSLSLCNIWKWYLSWLVLPPVPSWVAGYPTLRIFAYRCIWKVPQSFLSLPQPASLYECRKQPRWMSEAHIPLCFLGWVASCFRGSIWHSSRPYPSYNARVFSA